MTISPSTIIVFGQALAGLGHLRVTDALYRSMPPGTQAVLLGSQDKTITVFHRFVSIHPATRAVFEWGQHGWREDVFTTLYRKWLRTHTDLLESQLATILAQHPQHPNAVLAIATHMALGHQFAAIKEVFAKKYNVRMMVVVVVTDDSPLKIWAVGGADMIFVPSDETKKRLTAYHKTQRSLAPATYITAPYMISQALAETLSPGDMSNRKKQWDADSRATIHMAIPLSGAAVQMPFFGSFMGALREQSDRFMFHIVSKDMMSTRRFLAAQRDKPNVEIHSSSSDREVVDFYKTLYDTEIIGLEVTKPSEQAFKTLLSPKRRGGAILLFSDPVGRQEWDNLAFMEKHGLIPTNAALRTQWKTHNGSIPPDADMLAKARTWRGLRLPGDPREAAGFTLWCLRYGIFAAMGNFSGYRPHSELSPDGVTVFWKLIQTYLTHQ